MARRPSIGSFHIGDHVKLTERGVKNQCLAKRKVSIDWAHRYGIIYRINKQFAYVLWEGRRSVDDVPIQYIELVQEM